MLKNKGKETNKSIIVPVSVCIATVATVVAGYMVWDCESPKQEKLQMGWSELDLHQFHSDEKILQLTREVELLKYQVNHNEVE